MHHSTKTLSHSISFFIITQLSQAVHVREIKPQGREIISHKAPVARRGDRGHKRLSVFLRRVRGHLFSASLTDSTNQARQAHLRRNFVRGNVGVDRSTAAAQSSIRRARWVSVGPRCSGDPRRCIISGGRSTTIFVIVVCVVVFVNGYHEPVRVVIQLIGQRLFPCASSSGAHTNSSGLGHHSGSRRRRRRSNYRASSGAAAPVILPP